jgi:hypothetical protein
MSQNPYLINTGGLFGWTWGKSLKDSYAFSQIIYITNLLEPLYLEKIEYFKKEDFHNYVTCKKLVQNLGSLMQNKLDTIAEYQRLKIYYNSVSKKIGNYVILKKRKYNEATEKFNCFITDTMKYKEHNAAFQLMSIKKHVLDYFDLLISLGKLDPKDPILNLLPKIEEQENLNDKIFNSQ